MLRTESDISISASNMMPKVIKHNQAFVICKVAYGHGHSTFDYIGVDKIAKRKVLLNVKSGKHTKKSTSISFSSNEKEVIQDAKTLKFDVYVAYIIFLRKLEN